MDHSQLRQDGERRIVVRMGGAFRWGRIFLVGDYDAVFLWLLACFLAGAVRSGGADRTATATEQASVIGHAAWGDCAERRLA